VRKGSPASDADHCSRRPHDRRRPPWFPWRLRRRKVSSKNVDPFDFLVGVDDLPSLVFAVVTFLAVLLFGGIVATLAIFASEALLLLLLLVPLLVVARLLWIAPWVIEARSAGTTLGLVKVRGWRGSQERIRDLAEAYRRGEDPFRRVTEPA
jgi:hypothetical protein